MSKQNGNKGRRFDRAFKEEAVRLLQTSGHRQRQIAGDLGISVSALGRWVAELREEDLLSGPHEDAAKEITRLRRERDLARQERDLLKKRWPSSPGKVDEVPVHRRREGRVGDADIPPVQTAAGQRLRLLRLAQSRPKPATARCHGSTRPCPGSLSAQPRELRCRAGPSRACREWDRGWTP